MKGTGRPTFADPKELFAGRELWLYPNTKLSSRACHAGLAAVVVKVPTSWPLVLVRHKDGEELVHRDNLRNTPAGFVKQTKSEGDGQNSSTPDIKIKHAFPPHKPLADGDYEEPMLF